MREPADNPKQRDLWRGALARVTGVKLLSSSKEAANPAAADQAIEAAVDQALHYGQDDRFPILVSENAQYGLERNLYGFRWVGRLIALFCIGVLAAALRWGNWAPQGAVTAGIITNALFLVAWFFVPSATRAKEAGFRYAAQLMRTVVRMDSATSRTRPIQSFGPRPRHRLALAEVRATGL
jgi:hypothetical protein